MPSRPQFSLRVLLFVMAMVCLGAATVHRAPPKDWHGSDQEWEDLGFAVHVQSWLRLAACVVFPAALVAAAVARDGYIRAFCLGALLPAAIPLVLVSLTGINLRGVAFTVVLTYLAVMSHMLSERIAALWLCTPCVGLVSVVAHRLLKMPGECGAAPQRNYIVRASLMALIVCCAWMAIIALPSSATPIGTQSNAWRQMPLRLMLCFGLPAVLVTGTLQGQGVVRVFCASGLLPALAPAILVSGIDIMVDQLDGRWEPEAIVRGRYFIFAMWALVPCFGLTAVLFYLLFRRGERT